ncbi:MAG: hypothetical protein KDA88_16345 [Planctomycetaceae bacterium]|nr:hypothetical protein [Planctomycetaceae bacterium]
MNVVTMSRMALLAGAVALTATLLAQQPNDSTPQPLPQSSSTVSDTLPDEPDATGVASPPQRDAPAAEAPADVATSVVKQKTSDAASGFIEPTNAAAEAEFVKSIKAALDEKTPVGKAPTVQIPKAAVTIKAQPELDHTILVALINQLKSLGIGRFALGTSTNGRSSIKLELPEDASYVEVQKLGAAIRQQQGFDYDLQVGSNIVETYVRQDDGDWGLKETLPNNSDSALADAYDDQSQPPQVVKVYVLKFASAESAVKTLKALFTDDNLAIHADERTNSVIVRADEEIHEVIATLLKEIDDFPPAKWRNSAGEEDDDKGFTLSIQGGSSDNKRELQQRFNSFESRAQQLAVQIQRLKNSGGSETQEIKRLTKELESTVRQAFTLRQSLHRTELVDHARRLQTIHQSIANRDALADQIIQHRVEELLNPNLHWTATPQAAPKRVILVDNKPTEFGEMKSGALVFPVPSTSDPSYVARVPVQTPRMESEPIPATADPREQILRSTGEPSLPSLESQPSFSRPKGQTGARDFHERYTKHLSNMKRMREERARYLRDLEKIDGSTAPRDQVAAKSLRAVSDSLQSQLASEQAAFEFLEEEYETQVKLYELELQQHLETLTGAQREFERMKRLAEQGATTQSKVAEMSAKVRFTQLQIEQVKAELDLLLKTRPVQPAVESEN